MGTAGGGNEEESLCFRTNSKDVDREYHVDRKQRRENRRQKAGDIRVFSLRRVGRFMRLRSMIPSLLPVSPSLHGVKYGPSLNCYPPDQGCRRHYLKFCAWGRHVLL